MSQSARMSGVRAPVAMSYVQAWLNSPNSSVAYTSCLLSRVNEYTSCVTLPSCFVISCGACFFAREVDEIDVGVGAGARLDEREIATVGRDLGELPGRVVLEDQRARVVLRRVAIQVERLRVALVRRDEEVLLVGGPAEELRLGLVAGRQVARRAVRFAHVQMVDLVAAAVRGEQHAPVGRKP